MQSAERAFVQISLAVITAATVGNALVNWKGTTEIAKVFLGFPVNIANALARRPNG